MTSVFIGNDWFLFPPARGCTLSNLGLLTAWRGLLMRKPTNEPLGSCPGFAISSAASVAYQARVVYYRSQPVACRKRSRPAVCWKHTGSWPPQILAVCCLARPNLAGRGVAARLVSRETSPAAEVGGGEFEPLFTAKTHSASRYRSTSIAAPLRGAFEAGSFAICSWSYFVGINGLQDRQSVPSRVYDFQSGPGNVDGANVSCETARATS